MVRQRLQVLVLGSLQLEALAYVLISDGVSDNHLKRPAACLKGAAGRAW